MSSLNEVTVVFLFLNATRQLLHRRAAERIFGGRGVEYCSIFMHSIVKHTSLTCNTSRDECIFLLLQAPRRGCGKARETNE